MTSLQLQDFFPRINVVSILVCTASMYFFINTLKLQILGYLMGFSSRFLVEMVWELVIVCRNFPREAAFVPSFKYLRSGFAGLAWFGFVYIVGYSAELVLFELVPFILFQTRFPSRNIALWMSLYQFACLSDGFVGLL